MFQSSASRILFTGLCSNIIFLFWLFFFKDPMYELTLAAISNDGFGNPLFGISLLLFWALETVALSIKLYKSQQRRDRNMPWWGFPLWMGHVVSTGFIIATAFDAMGGFNDTLFMNIGLGFFMFNVLKEFGILYLMYAHPPKTNPSYSWFEALSDVILVCYFCLSFTVLWMGIADDPDVSFRLTREIDDLIPQLFLTTIILCLTFFPMRLGFIVEETLMADTWKERLSLWVSTSIAIVFALSMLVV